ncbi:MAG: DUF3224 domain-containing protein [Planctomycetota bacterium]
MPTYTARFKHLSWNEEPTSEKDIEGPRLTRASVVKEYEGDVTGTGTVEFVMAYVTDATAAFVGVERFEGSIGDRKGTLLLEHHGVFDQGRVTDTWTTVANSGTEALAGVDARVQFEAGHAEQFACTFEVADSH